jgi:hypothetical protein
VVSPWLEHFRSTRKARWTMLVGIPTVGLSPHLNPLIEHLKDGGHSVVLYCNGDSTDARRVIESVPNGFTVVLCPGVNIHGVWNRILRAAYGEPVAIFNDDISVDAGSLGYAESYFKHRPQAGIIGWDPDVVVRGDRHDLEVHGSYRHHGITGFAFALRPVPDIWFDEEFNWWGGDDDIIHQYLVKGYKAVKMVGEPVAHWPSTSANQRPEVYSKVELDRQRLLDKWGDTW